MPNRAPSLRRDAPRPQSPRGRHSTETNRRPSSSSSTGSSTSNLTSLSIPKRSPYQANPQPSNAPRSPSAMQGANSSNTNLPNFSRPSAPLLPQNEPVARRPSPLGPSHEVRSHRPRQHSQGFFEPSLPTASISEHNNPANMSNLTASQIAAQTAVTQSFRNRSQSIPASQDNIAGGRNKSRKRESPPPIYTGYQGQPPGPKPASPVYQNGVAGGRALAATTAANVAFPRNQNLPHPPPPADHAQETGHKHKGEKSKMKLFSKPKHIGISRDKGGDQRDKALPSPNKIGLPGPSGLSRMMTASTTSLNEIPSSGSSMYNQTNSSANTVVLAERPSYEKEREKEKDKHKHHFLSRQKLKLKDKDEHRNLPLSSASSNSKPLDPNAPQSLYSFAPSSPSTTSFSKSKSGLDLRHGGRALREKKREEKASAAAGELDHGDWLANGIAGAGSSTTLVASSLGNSSAGVYADHSLKDTLQGFGLQNMTPEDAWDFLKAKLIVLFEGEDIRIALEDLNKLVSIHIQRCVREKMPFAIVEDLRDLLQTGFSSLNHSIHSVPDERLVPYLAQMWLFVFGTVLPFIQAVFFPLDLEFKGRGSIMTSREAKEFWGALPNGESSNTSIGDELEVRTIVLVSFRDTIILSRYESLKAIFSRLSLDSINANVSTTSTGGSSRPSTASTLDPGFGSYNSQSSTLFNAPGSYSSESAISRSRAASNTSSNPDNMIFQSSYANISPPSSSRGAGAGTGKGTADPSLLITETVGRMLQCISVLASVQSDDDPQRQIETLSKTLKHNWLGRGRTGRDRRGFVGTRVRPPVTREDDAMDGVGRAGIMGTGLFRDRSNSEAAHAVLVNGR